MKENKNIFLIVGIVAVLGIAAFFIFKPKTPTTPTETPAEKEAREKADKAKADADALAIERAKETPAERAARIAQEADLKAKADAEAARLKAIKDAAAAAAAAEALRLKNEELRRLKKCYRNSYVNNDFEKWEQPTIAQVSDFHRLMRSRFDERFTRHAYSWFYGMDYKLDFSLANQRMADINNYIELAEERSPIYQPTGVPNVAYALCEKLPSLYQKGEFRCDIPYTPPVNRQGLMGLLGFGDINIFTWGANAATEPTPPVVVQRSRGLVLPPM